MKGTSAEFEHAISWCMGGGRSGVRVGTTSAVAKVVDTGVGTAGAFSRPAFAVNVGDAVTVFGAISADASPGDAG